MTVNANVPRTKEALGKLTLLGKARGGARVCSITLAWTCAITFGMVTLARYANTSGPGNKAPDHWPQESAAALDPQHLNLILFIHPHCPCSHATVEELSSLMAHLQGRMNAQIWFIQPAGTSRDWITTNLWRAATAIPGVTVHRDANGMEAHRFAAGTSGQVALYSASGGLLFQGGITIARGHTGDNPGLLAIKSIALNQTSPIKRTGVFGCPLFSLESPPKEVACQ